MAAGTLLTAMTVGVIAFTGRGETGIQGHIELVAADCNAAAQRVVSRTGGQLLSVSSSKQGGKTVCRVTVLAPSSHGKRPRKMTVTVPQ